MGKPELVITPEGYCYYMDWGKPKLHRCGALNNTEMLKNCAKCGGKL